MKKVPDDLGVVNIEEFHKCFGYKGGEARRIVLGKDGLAKKRMVKGGSRGVKV